jgi:hypothetical protein
MGSSKLPRLDKGVMFISLQLTYGVGTVQAYNPAIERRMKEFYDTLSEKDKRRYAGVEAMKLGRGGVAYIIRVLGCSRKTVLKGLRELNTLSQDEQPKKNA